MHTHVHNHTGIKGYIFTLLTLLVQTFKVLFQFFFKHILIHCFFDHPEDTFLKSLLPDAKIVLKITTTSYSGKQPITTEANKSVEQA